MLRMINKALEKGRVSHFECGIAITAGSRFETLLSRDRCLWAIHEGTVREAFGRSARQRDAEQIVLVGILDQHRNDIARLQPGGVAQVDLAVDLGRIGL